jgi:ComF family protein
MWKTILDLLFPITCLGCGREGKFICFNCFKQMSLNKKTPFRFNAKSSLSGLIIASHYKHLLVKQAIHRYKYDFVQDLAKPLGQLMINRLNLVLETSQESFKNPLLIPIPLHPKRLRWRGFNQAELLTLEVSQKLKIPLANNILIRSKYNLPQANIKNSLERKENVKQAFQINPDFKDNLKNKTIILIDDISTTGATLKEAAKTLRSLKPKTIWGLVVAQG